jgi:hypothetical protein
MPSSKQLYDLECFILRATYKAVLLTPAVVKRDGRRDESLAAIQEWFPPSAVDVEGGSPAADHVGQIVTATIPEWLIDEKGWEDYV